MADAKDDKYYIEKMLLKLNAFLEEDPMDKRRFNLTIRQLKKKYQLKISILDFKYFDEHRLYKARLLKRKAEKLSNFEYANHLSHLESVCEKYIELKRLYHFHQSVFLLDEQYLLFCRLGTSKNDSLIIRRLLKDENFVRMNIKIDGR